MNTDPASIWATVVAYGRNHDKAERLQSELKLDSIKRKRLEDGVRAIYARDGIREISDAEMKALASSRIH